MAGTFDIRMRELEERVGAGRLQAKVVFDQPYAHRQHEDLTLQWKKSGEAEPTTWLEALQSESGAKSVWGQVPIRYQHPHGGGPKYLEKALFFHYAEYYEILAKGLLTIVEVDRSLVDAMQIVGEFFRHNAQVNAPTRDGDLRDSAWLVIVDDEAIVRALPATRTSKTRQQIASDNERHNKPPEHIYGALPPLPKAGRLTEAEAIARARAETKKYGRRSQGGTQNPQRIYDPGARSGGRRRTGPMRPGSD